MIHVHNLHSNLHSCKKCITCYFKQCTHVQLDKLEIKKLADIAMNLCGDQYVLWLNDMVT